MANIRKEILGWKCEVELVSEGPPIEERQLILKLGCLDVAERYSLDPPDGERPTQIRLMGLLRESR